MNQHKPQTKALANVEFASELITFVTHLRYDHQDRLDNLQCILDFYSFYFPNSRFILVEDDKTHNSAFDKISWPLKKTSFYFIENSGLYYRTRALNYGIKQSKTPIVVSLDTDCLVSPDSIKLCSFNLLNGATIAWPYNGYFVDTHQQFRDNQFKTEKLFSAFDPYIPNLIKLGVGERYEYFSIRGTNNEPRLVGGIVMFNKENFLRIGGYNENFIAWGAEDEEVVIRCKILNHQCYRDANLNSLLFHLNHHNALRQHHQFYNSNVDELTKVSNMNEIELKSYIETWPQ